MQWPPWMVRASKLYSVWAGRHLGDVIADFLKCNTGKAFAFEALMDHVNAHCGDKYTEYRFRAELKKLLNLKGVIRKVGRFYTSAAR